VSRRETRLRTDSVATAASSRAPEGPDGNFGRQLGACGGAAVRATPTMQPVLGHLHGDLGQLRDLVARWLPDPITLRVTEHMPAAAALGPTLHHQADRLHRQQSPPTTWMSRLGPLLACGGTRSLALGRPGRILARWRGRVARVAVQAPLEVGDPLVLAGHALSEPLNLLIHPQQHRNYHLAAPLVDRLRLDPLHAIAIRRPDVTSP
jgi:hypothetical protein